MRVRTGFTNLARSPRLWRRSGDDPASYWTEALGEPAAQYGERTASMGSTTLRRWDPARSKLGAAIAKGWTEPLPRPGERWLYLGAAAGTTSSHVADLVGRGGAVYAVEKSLRPFARLIGLAERYPNIAPILADARRPEEYEDDVPPTTGVYADVAQPDQVEIVLGNARRMLAPGGALLLALKTSSMGRERGPRAHLGAAADALEGEFDIVDSIALDPFHRKHYLVGARATKRLGRPRGGAAVAATRPTRPSRVERRR